MTKKLTSLFMLSFLIVSVPVISFAGGNFKDMLQQKLNVSNKRQSQQNDQYYDKGQYEPYYSQRLEENDKTLRERKVEAEESRGFAGQQVNAPASVQSFSSLGTKEVLESRVLGDNESYVIAPYLVYRTEYKAEIDEDVVTVKGNVLLEVFRKGWTKVPIVGADVGLIDAVISRGTSFVLMQDGKYYILIDKPGKYSLDMEFLIKAKRERENGPGNFTLSVIPAPISQFEFTIPEANVEIFVDPSIKTELFKETKKTIAWAVMPNTSSVSVRWSKALPKQTITPVKLEPKVYVDTATYAAIGDGAMRCISTLTYSILQSEVPNFRVALPDDVTVLNVSGNDLRDWKVSHDKGTQYIDVYPNFGIKGNYILSVSYERKIADGSGVVQVPWVKAMSVEREKGFFGIAAASSVELAVKKAGHISAIDVKELPETIWNNTSSPILLAFKYLNHPFTIEIEVTKHEEVPVLVAAIDIANYITLQTDEGKNLTKAIFQVRNNVKQFIHLRLPSRATLWSVFVAGNPVKPVKDKSGAILIPLEKSQMSGETLAQFPVEVVYLDSLSKMHIAGRLKLELPKTDIPISSLQWSVYFPREYEYLYFGGNVKTANSGFGVGVGGILAGSVSKMKSERRSGEVMLQSQVAGVYDEFKKAQVRGVLPIKIELPEEGRLFRFSKLLVAEKEDVFLSTIYCYGFGKIGGLLRFFVFVGVFLALYIWIRRLFKKYILNKNIK